MHVILVRAAYPIHHIDLDFISLICENAKSWNSFLIFSIPCYLGPNVVRNVLFSNTVSLSFSLRIWDHILHPYKTTDKTVDNN
jgi:hypothetical protein